MTNESIETLATGYGLIEGPRADGLDGLYFSDATNGGVYRRSREGEVETVVPKRRGVGGIALHAEGGIVVSGRNICHVRDGHTRMLFDPGVPGFNDIFTDARGRVYAGSLGSSAFADDEERVPGELYRIDEEGKGLVLYGDVSLTNGIGFSPDGARLYHSDTARNQILVHDVGPDGGCGNRRVFARLRRGVPDGLAVDEEGFVWVAAYGGGCVSRLASDGSVERHVEVPAQGVTSLCFGGGDRRDLYVVSTDNTDDEALGGCVFRTRAPVAGLEVPPARV
jgi:gluconolactonase